MARIPCITLFPFLEKKKQASRLVHNCNIMCVDVPINTH